MRRIRYDLPEPGAGLPGPAGGVALGIGQGLVQGLGAGLAAYQQGQANQAAEQRRRENMAQDMRKILLEQQGRAAGCQRALRGVEGRGRRGK